MAASESAQGCYRGSTTFKEKLIALFHPYRPYKHYMRGPGPKTLNKIGERLRAESDGVTQEPVPQRWLDLIGSLAKQQQIRNSFKPDQR